MLPVSLPPDKLAGQSLAPLFQNEAAQWREHLYTEYHLHSAHNFFPQRTVRDARYKLIQNLQPDQINPGYAFTINRFFEGLPDVVQAASPRVRSAYPADGATTRIRTLRLAE